MQGQNINDEDFVTEYRYSYSRQFYPKFQGTTTKDSNKYVLVPRNTEPSVEPTSSRTKYAHILVKYFTQAGMMK